MNKAEKQALIDWLRNEIKLIQSDQDEVPFGLDYDGEMALKGVKVALASLTAEPVGYTNETGIEALSKGYFVSVCPDPRQINPIALFTTLPVPSSKNEPESRAYTLPDKKERLENVSCNAEIYLQGKRDGFNEAVEEVLRLNSGSK